MATTPWTIETFMRNWLGKNEVLTEARSYRKNAVTKLDNEQKKQERKLAGITKQIDKLTADKNKIAKLISDLTAEKTNLNKG